MLIKHTESDVPTAHERVFLESFGVPPKQRGPLPQDTPRRVAEYFVYSRYGSRLNRSMLEEFVSIAYVACYGVKPDPDRMAYEQVKYLENAAFFAIKNEVEKQICRRRKTRWLYLSQLRFSEDSEDYVLRQIADPNGSDEFAEYDANEQWLFHRQLFERYLMTDRERTVFNYVCDGLNYSQIGHALGISRSRAHQIFSSYRNRLLKSNPAFLRELRDEY